MLKVDFKGNSKRPIVVSVREYYDSSVATSISVICLDGNICLNILWPEYNSLIFEIFIL